MSESTSIWRFHSVAFNNLLLVEKILLQAMNFKFISNQITVNKLLLQIFILL